MSVVALILKFLPQLIIAVDEGYDLIKKLTATLNQVKELTPEEEEARDNITEGLNTRDWWKPSE